MRFFNSDAEALPFLADAEIVFGQSAALAKNAPALRWLCTPSAGVNQFMGDHVFASPDAVLTNSSGAYGVTIAEHIVMLTLEALRRQKEYSAIVARREWKRDLPVRSIRDSRITLLGTGDIGREAAIRLRAFGPACLRGVNRSGSNPGGLFDAVAKQENLAQVLPETDILIASLPGTAETFHMAAARSSTSRHWSPSCARDACARRWTCSSRSRCPRTAPCGTAPTCSSPRTRRAT